MLRVHNVAIITDWLVARRVQLLQHPPYLPDLAPADFFLFPKVNKDLEGLTLTSKTFMKVWEGALRTLMVADFAEASHQWYRRCENCITIGSNNVEKT